MHKRFWRFAAWPVMCLLLVQGSAFAGKVGNDCTYNGIVLKGRVKVVSAFATFDVKKSAAFCDLYVKEVSAFAGSCGEWEFVDAFEDFSVRFVDSFEDFSICPASSFPGVR